MERWKDILEFDGYSVSSVGRIRSNISGKILKQTKSGSGYLSVTLYSRYGRRQRYVHRLVAIEFIANRLHYQEVNHIDGDKLNNAVDNLEWCSRSMNCKHAIDHGLSAVPDAKGGNNPRAKLNSAQVELIRSEYQSGLYTQKQLSEQFSVSRSLISEIVRNKCWNQPIS